MTFQDDIAYLIRTDAMVKGGTLKAARERMASRLGIPAETLKNWQYGRNRPGFKPKSTTKRGVPVAKSVQRSAQRRRRQILTLERGQFVDITGLFQELTFDAWTAGGAAQMLTGPVPAIAAEKPGAQVVAEVEIDLTELEGVIIDKSSKGLHITLDGAVSSFLAQINEFFEKYSVYGDVVAMRPRRVIFKSVPVYDGQKFQKMEEVQNTLNS